VAFLISGNVKKAVFNRNPQPSTVNQAMEKLAEKFPWPEVVSISISY